MPPCSVAFEPTKHLTKDWQNSSRERRYKSSLLSGKTFMQEKECAMQPTQSRPGYFWTTDDVAQLWFGESGPEPPQSVRCYNMQDHLNSGEAREVPVSGARVSWRRDLRRSAAQRIEFHDPMDW